MNMRGGDKSVNESSGYIFTGSPPTCVLHTLSRESDEFFSKMLTLELQDRSRASIEEKVLGFHTHQLNMLSQQIIFDLNEAQTGMDGSREFVDSTKILIFLDRSTTFEDLKREFKKRAGLLSQAFYLFVGEMSHYSCMTHLNQNYDKYSLVIVVSDHTLESCAHSVSFRYIYVPLYEKVLTISKTGNCLSLVTQTLSRNAIKKRIALLHGRRASVRYLAGSLSLDMSKHRDVSVPVYTLSV